MGLKVVDGKVVDTDAPKLSVQFYEHTKKVGVGQYEPVVFISLKARGCRDFMSRPATDADKRDYPEEWEAFQQGHSVEEGETPLKQLPGFKMAFALELKAKGVDSVESLALREEPEEEYLRTMWKQARHYVALLEMEQDEQREEIQTAGNAT